MKIKDTRKVLKKSETLKDTPERSSTYQLCMLFFKEKLNKNKKLNKKNVLLFNCLLHTHSIILTSAICKILLWGDDTVVKVALKKSM